MRLMYVHLHNSGQQTAESEAMWIDFKCAPHNAYLVKIYCGGVNAISGEPAVETVATRMNRLRRLTSLKNPDDRYDYDSDSNFESDSGYSSDPKNIDNASPLQDYVVVPSQTWLDGIADSDGTVRQFVAMPFNSSHSIEYQTTGADAVGGFQFEITPAQVPYHTSPSTCSEGMEGAFPVSVLTLAGKVISIWTFPQNRISDIKARIQQSEGIAPTRQRLVFAGRQLHGSTLL
jgi:hypothetical protein